MSCAANSARGSGSERSSRTLLPAHASRVAITDDRSGSEARFATLPLELALVWVLFALVAVEILVTYSRLPARELYHVSRSGLAGGASRAVVFLNFPLALVAIPILAFVSQRLTRRSAKVAAAIGIVLSAAIFWPGIVKQSDLDARPVNAVAAIGVLIALSLTAVTARRLERPLWPVRQPGDRLRVVVVVVALALAVPWIAADLGLFFDGVPVLGTLYQTGELRAQPGVTALHPAVHHGHHHGMDGVLLVLSALLLSRLLSSVPRGWLRGLLGGYLALLFCYGAGNIANDFWLEQVVKRGWTNWQIPDVTTPKASVAWGVIVLSATALSGASVWRGRGRQRPAGRQNSLES
jgi:hypothetical protein